MKSGCLTVSEVRVLSHPSRGAWIEITGTHSRWRHSPSHPSRGAWIEIPEVSGPIALAWSHPSRGAWIEIGVVRLVRRAEIVAPLTGCVD